MTDLSKPIRRRDDKRPARVLATDLPGRRPFVVAWEHVSDKWFACEMDEGSIRRIFENVPPPEEWRWRYDEGTIGAIPFTSAEECREKLGPHPGQPVRILREGEAP